MGEPGPSSPKPTAALPLQSTRWHKDFRAVLPVGRSQAYTYTGLPETVHPKLPLGAISGLAIAGAGKVGIMKDRHCNFLLLQADPRGWGCPGGSFPLRPENAVVSMETKALEGLGAAFLPVPPTHAVNWVSLLGAGARVNCSVHQRVRAIVPSDILQPCPASEPGILRGAFRRS